MAMRKGYRYAEDKVRTVILTNKEKKDKLLEIAEKENKSINKIIESLIDEYLERIEKNK